MICTLILNNVARAPAMNNIVEINHAGIRQPIYTRCRIEESMYHGETRRLGKHISMNNARNYYIGGVHELEY